MPSKASGCFRSRIGPVQRYGRFVPIIGGAVLGLALACRGWRLTEEALNWIMSTVAQAMVALAALAGVVAVFKMQTVHVSAQAYKAANLALWAEPFQLDRSQLYGIRELAQRARRYVDKLQEQHQKAVNEEDKQVAARSAALLKRWREPLHHLTELAYEEASVRQVTGSVVELCLLAGGTALLVLFLAPLSARWFMMPVLVGALLGVCGSSFLILVSLVKVCLHIRKI